MEQDDTSYLLKAKVHANVLQNDSLVPPNGQKSDVHLKALTTEINWIIIL
jgi:hypothetical protein